MKQEKVNTEQAETEFGMLCEFLGVDFEDNMDDEDAADLSRLKTKVVKAIRRGALTVSEDGQPTYTNDDGVDMVFKKPRGSILLVKTKGSDENRRMFAMIQELTGAVSSPSKWSPRDTGVLMAIVTLFISELL